MLHSWICWSSFEINAGTCIPFHLLLNTLQQHACFYQSCTSAFVSYFKWSTHLQLLSPTCSHASPPVLTEEECRVGALLNVMLGHWRYCQEMYQEKRPLFCCIQVHFARSRINARQAWPCFVLMSDQWRFGEADKRLGFWQQSSSTWSRHLPAGTPFPLFLVKVIGLCFTCTHWHLFLFTMWHDTVAWHCVSAVFQVWRTSCVDRAGKCSKKLLLFVNLDVVKLQVRKKFYKDRADEAYQKWEALDIQTQEMKEKVREWSRERRRVMKG